MDKKAYEVFLYLQERCLWQFHSRAWDREDNISNIKTDIMKLLVDKKINNETLIDKCHYADARILADDLKRRFPWLMEMSETERNQILSDGFDKLFDVTVTHSLNAELNNENY